MNLMVVSQEESDRFDAAVQAAANKAAQQNVRKIQPRHSVLVKIDLDNLRQRVADNQRQLTEAEGARVELSNSLDTVAKRLASLRAAGVSEKSESIQTITGFDFFSKTFQASQHHEGSLEIMAGELKRLDERIVRLQNGVLHWTKVLADSGLEAELAEAIKLERLGG